MTSRGCISASSAGTRLRCNERSVSQQDRPAPHPRHACSSLAMGNVYSFSSPPPGAAIIEIESRECCASCSARPWDPSMRKPQQASAWSDGQWSSFSNEMGAQVQKFKRDGCAGFALLLIPFGLIMLLIGLSVSGPRERKDGEPVRPLIFGGLTYAIHVPFIILSIIILICVSSCLRSANEAVDANIHDLCRRYSDSSVTLQYATEFTGQCKPKGARTYRALYIVPGGGGGMPVATASAAMTQMQVACPSGNKSGDPIMIQTPSGIQYQAVIPNGVMPGQLFTVQVPAQQVIPTVMATAVSPV